MFHRITEVTLAAEMKIVIERKKVIHQVAGTKENRRERDHKFRVSPTKYHALGN